MKLHFAFYILVIFLQSNVSYGISEHGQQYEDVSKQNYYYLTYSEDVHWWNNESDKINNDADNKLNLFSEEILPQNKNICEDDFIIQEIEGEPVQFTWTTSVDPAPNGGYVSHPPCIDSNMAFAYRYCANNTWSLAPMCHKVQNAIPECPEGYLPLLNDNERTPYCYFLSEPGSPKCPFQDELSGHVWLYHEYASDLTNETVWFPLIRNVSNGFGPLMDVGIGATDVDFDNFATTGNFAGKNCVGFRSGTYELVDCNADLASLCFFLGLDVLYSTSELVTYHNRRDKSRAFYLEILANSAREEFCADHKLAEPKDAHALMTINHIPFKPAVTNCWFGLEQLQERYVWSSDKETIAYTNWAYATNFTNNQFGFMHFHGNESSDWFMHETDHGWLSCGVCQIVVEYAPIKLELTYELNTKLVLNHYNKFKNNSDVVCYTNADALVTVVKHTLVAQLSTSDASYNVTTLKFPGQYWCKTFDPQNGKYVYSNTLLIYDSANLREYSLHATVRHDFVSEPTQNLTRYSNHLQNLINSTLPIVASVRVILIKEIDEQSKTMDIVLHITTSARGSDDATEHGQLKETISSLPSDDTYVKYGQFARSDLCFFASANANDEEITWNATGVQETALPNRFCMIDGALATRKCEGSFIDGASWSSFDGACDRNVAEEENDITDDLYQLLISDLHPNEIVHEVLKLTRNPEVIRSEDFTLMTYIFKKVTTTQVPNGVNATAALMTVSNMMDADRMALSEAQRAHSTDRMLTLLDEFTLFLSTADIKTKNLLTNVIDLKTSNVNGIALTSSGNGVGFTYYDVTYLTSDAIEEELSQTPNLEIAVVIPPELKEQIANLMDARLILTSFHKDSLFNEVNGATSVGSRIVSITVPNVHNLSAPVLVWFKNLENNQGRTTCGYWNYNSSSLGTWSEDYYQKQEVGDSLTVCYFDHLTHFGLLVGSEVSEADSKILTILTAVGVSLSTLGILAIAVTAVVFKTWRDDKGHQILLQVCLAIVLEYVFLYVAAAISDPNATEPSTMCTFVGYALCYVVLSQFCWMMVIAILQYRRFIVIFRTNMPHLLLKAAAVGWILPLLPILIIVSVSPRIEFSQTICYPSGLSFWLGVLTPVLLVIIVNTILFVTIIRKLPTNRKALGNRDNASLILAVVRLAIFLFFILGLSWLFGIFSAIGLGVAFGYLFCITAPLQGVVLFLFFIVFSEKTKHMWTKLMRRITSDETKPYGASSTDTSAKS